MSEPEQRIRERAYHLWREAGRPPGRNEQFWFAAEREIENEVPAVGAQASGAIDHPSDGRTPEEPSEMTDPVRKPPRGTEAAKKPPDRAGNVANKRMRSGRAPRTVISPGEGKSPSFGVAPTPSGRGNRPPSRPGHTDPAKDGP
jgi:hypothetical protein